MLWQENRVVLVVVIFSFQFFYHWAKESFKVSDDFAVCNIFFFFCCLQGVRVFIEKKAQLTLLGTEMDYVEDKLSSEFVFNNPNIKGTCGCGESFNI